MFEGVFTALVTPFKEGVVDYEALGALIDEQIEGGVNGVVPCGTTGESPTLTVEEHREIVRFTAERAEGKTRVIAGTGSNSTREAIEMTKHAAEVGVDGALIITPYYNCPTQEGIFRHFEAIAKEVDLPIILYNVPSRTAVSFTIDTIVRLSGFPNMIAIKEASGNLELVSEILERTHLKVLSGDDELTEPLLNIGGHGVISVVSNLIPARIVQMVKSWQKGETELCQALHENLLPLARAMFIETNPIPIKTALELVGKGNGEMRLPMCEMSEENRKRLRSTLKNFKLLP